MNELDADIRLALEDLTREFVAVYGWHVNEKKQCVPPAPIFPPVVHERVKWASSYMNEAGLSFSGAFDAVLAYDEEARRKEFEFAGEWLPVSKEFRDWRDEPFKNAYRDMQIAIALIYGDVGYKEGEGK